MSLKTRLRVYFLLLIACILTLPSCALMEISGRMTRKTGEAMERIGEERKGTFIGKMASLGGRINKSVGSTVENMAKTEKHSGKSLRSANSAVMGAAVNAAKGNNSGSACRNEIRRIQEILKKERHYTGTADGIWGKRSKKALRLYQAEKGLPVTGKLDRATCRSFGF